MNTRLRRIACAAALPLFPLTLLVSTLVAPTDSEQNADQLRAATLHGGRWQASALLELLAAALLPLAVAGIVSSVRARGAGLATAGGGLGVLGTLGMAAIAFRHLFIYGLTAAGEAQALRALDRVDHHAGAAALPLMIAAPLALILLAGAVARARIASRWVLAGAIAFGLVDMFPLPAAEEIQGVLGVATFGFIAWRLLHARTEPVTEGARERRLEAAGASV
jgi:hypothetical protein